AASLIRRTARVRVASRKRLLAETGLLRRTESSFSSPHKTHTLREAFVQNIDFLCRCRRRGDQLLCGDEPMYRPTDSMAAPAITWRKGWSGRIEELQIGGGLVPWVSPRRGARGAFVLTAQHAQTPACRPLHE